MTPALSVAQPGAQPPAQPGANGKAPGADRSVPESAGRLASRPAQGQSRLLKGASPLQSRPRRPAGEARWSLARCLTERDRAIVRALARHRVFTREQLGQMFFDSQHRARVRLVALHRHQVLDRFQPHRPGWGSASYHYVLGPMGASIVAAEAGDDPDRAARRWRAERTLALGRTQRLAHFVGVNGFYAALVGHARATPGAELADWLTEAEATRWADAIVRPDAYGSWCHDGDAVEFFLEWDRGTETLVRLVAKLDGYERFESERGASAWVLFAFPSPRRESAARRALAGATVPVATSVVGAGAGPHDAVWLALPDNGHGRVGLASLSRLPLPPAATARAGAGNVRAWRFDRSRPADDEGADGGP